jgi:hypothetical protein
MRKRFEVELSKNLKYGFFAIGIILLFMGGYYLQAVHNDFDRSCASCVTSDCMDNDVNCGDFGVYYFKFFTLIGMSVMGISMVIKNKVDIGEK